MAAVEDFPRCSFPPIIIRTCAHVLSLIGRSRESAAVGSKGLLSRRLIPPRLQPGHPIVKVKDTGFSIGLLFHTPSAAAAAA